LKVPPKTIYRIGTISAITRQPIELEVFKPSKEAQSFLDSIKKSWEVLDLSCCGLRHNRGSFRSFWPTWSGPEPQPQEGALCFFQKKRRKSASLEPLIDFPAFVVSKLGKKTQNKQIT